MRITLPVRVLSPEQTYSWNEGPVCEATRCESTIVCYAQYQWVPHNDQAHLPLWSAAGLRWSAALLRFAIMSHS